MAQMFLIHTFTGMEAEVLLAMAFDRYVAICAPLHYTTILTSRVLMGISVCIVIRPLLLTLPMVYLIYHLPFCQAYIIPHSYCEHMGIAKLSCGNIRINGIYGLFVVSFFVLNLVLIGISYIYILWAVLSPIPRCTTKSPKHMWVPYWGYLCFLYPLSLLFPYPPIWTQNTLLYSYSCC